MDDGYLLGPREIVFRVLQCFAQRIAEETGGQLVSSECKWYNPDPRPAEDIAARGFIPDKLHAVFEGIYLNSDGEIFRGIHVFNAPIGELDYSREVFEDKARETCRVIQNYASNLVNDHP